MFVELQQVNFNTEVPLPGDKIWVNLDHVMRITVRDSENEEGCTNAVLSYSDGSKSAVYVGPRAMSDALRRQRIGALHMLLPLKNQADNQPLSYDADVQFPQRILDPRAE